MNTYTHVHICTHNAHMQHIHMHMHTQAHRQEVWQGGASINRTAGLLEGGRGASHLAKYESGGWGGGGGVPLAIRHQMRGIDQPPWLQACIHTWPHAHTHTCTHMQIHTYTRIHTHNAHILTHMHMCVCV